MRAEVPVREPQESAPPRIWTLGAVSFLNARPLVDALVDREGIVVRPAVPSRLAAMLESGACDAALMPVVDYWRRRNVLQRVSDACIASSGETMTVRVYSKVPPDKMERLHVDTHSHTSLVLARVIWREMYGRRLDLRPFDADDVNGPKDDVEGVLLIGDKVASSRRHGFGFEVDLGAAWMHLTGLPFVFAAWYAPRDCDCTVLSKALEQARDKGVADAARIASEQGPLHGWPVQLAQKYLCGIMQYKLTDSMRAAMDRFFGFIEQDDLTE